MWKKEEKSMPREPGNHQLFEEEIRGLVNLQFDADIGDYRCRHFPRPDGRWEIGTLRFEVPDAQGYRLRRFAICPDCYQVLRHRRGPGAGIWEGK